MKLSTIFHSDSLNEIECERKRKRKHLRGRFFLLHLTRFNWEQNKNWTTWKIQLQSVNAEHKRMYRKIGKQLGKYLNGVVLNEQLSNGPHISFCTILYPSWRKKNKSTYKNAMAIVWWWENVLRVQRAFSQIESASVCWLQCAEHRFKVGNDEMCSFVINWINFKRATQPNATNKKN